MGISGNVSTVSIIFMLVSAVLSILLPAGAIIYLGVKKRLNVKALLFGALLFVIFVLVLERLLHYFVLGSNPANSYIYRTPWLYMLYGGLAAGVFEESARLLGFKFLIRVKENESVNTGISYGLGHGGIEAVLLGGLGAVSNIVYSFLINSGGISSILKAMPSDRANAFIKSLSGLVSTPSYMFLISGFERFFALIIQVALSLIVLKAVTSKKWGLFVLAIFMHAAVDFAAALYQAGALKSIFVVELTAVLAAVLYAIVAYKLWSGRSRGAMAEGER